MKTKISLSEAEARAAEIVKELSPYCERIEIAGSIRRRKPEVGDIEIVAIPKPWNDLLGQPMPLQRDHALNYVDWRRIGGTLIKGGNKFKQIEMADGLCLDLFIVTPPAQWGVIFLIRTGSEDFSHKLVKSRQSGGLMPSNLKCKDGSIWHGMNILPTPEERDVFKVLGLAWISPENRA